MLHEALLASGGCRPRVLDLSAFDRRAKANYARLGPESVLSLSPADVGLTRLFKTAGPDLLLSGGRWRFQSMVRSFERLLTGQQARVVLLCHDYGYPEQALLLACQRLGLATARIDEGPFSTPLAAQAPGRRGLKNRALVVLERLGLLPTRQTRGLGYDLVLSTSTARAEAMRRRGIPADKVALVSSPRYDRLAALAELWPQRAKARFAEGLPSRILVVHQPFLRDGKVRQAAAVAAEDVLFDGLRLLAERRPLTVALRMHPRTDPGERERVYRRLRAAGIAFELSTAPSFYDELAEYDLFAGFYSSALLEAVACGAPAVVARLRVDDFFKQAEGLKAEAMERYGARVAETAEGLSAAMDDALQQKAPQTASRALLDDEIGPLDRDGSVKIAQRLLALARTNGRVPG